MRISDWSSDVCSSDLPEPIGIGRDLVLGIDRGDRILKVADRRDRRFEDQVGDAGGVVLADRIAAIDHDLDVQAVALEQQIDRKRGVQGKSVAVRVDLGGRRIIKKKQKEDNIDGKYQIKIKYKTIN